MMIPSQHHDGKDGKEQKKAVKDDTNDNTNDDSGDDNNDDDDVDDNDNGYTELIVSLADVIGCTCEEALTVYNSCNGDADRALETLAAKYGMHQ